VGTSDEAELRLCVLVLPEDRIQSMILWSSLSSIV
jgi:hypothetical protein